MSFGAGLSQGLQLGISSIIKKNEEKAREERMQEKLLEQRAYNTMEDTKKEFFKLGGTAKEAATYSGAENQYALELRMDELRAEYKAGIDASRTGKPLYAPDTETGTGEGTIQPSAGFQRGFENQQAATDEIKFNAGIQAKIAAEASAGERKAKREEDLEGVRNVASVNPQAGIDFSGAMNRQDALAAVAQNQNASQFAAEQMRFGVPTILNVGAGENVATPQMIAELDAAKERYATDKSDEAIRRGIKIRSDFELEQQYKQARDRANEDPGSVPPNIRFGYPEGDPALVRYFADEDKQDNDPFFRDAINLIPFRVKQSESEKGTPLTDDSGRLTKYGKVFLRKNVEDKPHQIGIDPVTGDKVYKNILTFMPLVVKPFTPTETPPDTTFNFDQGTNVQGSPFGSVPAEKGPTESSRFNPATGRPGSLGERRGEGTGENFPASQPERSVDQKFKAGFTDSKLSQAQRDVVESVIVDAGYKMEDVEGDYSDFARRISMSERNEAKFNLDRIYSEIDRAESSKTDIFGRKKNLSVSQKEKLESDLEKAMAELNPASSAYIEKERRFNIINSAYEKRPFMQKPKLRR